MELPEGYVIEPMTAADVDVLRGWAASEGWNPGLNDLRLVWDLAPASFVALRKGDALVGGGSILSYEGAFGFMGLFILRADERGKGLGTALWHWRRDTLRSRLKPGASIAMDGVFEMVPFYQRGGFEPAYQVLRYQGTAQGSDTKDVSALTQADFEDIDAYDRPIAQVPRAAFLRRWLTQPGGFAVGCRQNGALVGYGAARPCDTGFKIGPLFADSPEIAAKVGQGLMRNFEEQQVQIDVPEPNAAGIAWVTDLGLEKVFGCTRLYLGPALDLPLSQIFSVTSLEFG